MTRAKRLNWILIGGLVLAALLLSGGLHLVHGWQMARLTASFQARAARAEQENRLDDAIDILQRYLTLNPSHHASLVKLGDLLNRVASDPVGWSRALTVNEKVLAADRANHALRRRVAELAVKVGDLALAHDQLSTLRNTHPDDHEAAALRGDVLLLAGRPRDAVVAFQESIKAQPRQTVAYNRLARIYLHAQNQPALAEHVLDQMVAAQPDSPEAHLQRGYFYQAIGRLEEAGREFSRGRELALSSATPGSAAGAGPLFALAELALARGQQDTALPLLEQGRKEYPDVLAWYRPGAEQALLRGQAKEALDWLNAGLKVAPEDRDLWHLRIETCNQLKDFGTARADIARLRTLPTTPPGLADYLEARVLLGEGAVDQAAGQLERVLADRHLASWLRARAALSLADVAARRGQADQQLTELIRAVRLDSSLGRTIVQVGQLLLTQGRIAEAYELLQHATQQPEPLAEAFMAFARASLLHQLARPENQRNWHEPVQALRSVERLTDWQVEAALIHAETLLAQNKTDAAAQILTRATSQHPEDPRGWAGRAALARRQGRPDLARKLETEGLAKAKDPTPILIGTVQAGDRATAAEIKAAQKQLEARLEKLPRSMQILALQALARTESADAAARRLADLKPADGRSLLAALDLALTGRDADLVGRIVQALRDLEGKDSPTAQFGEAAWKVRTAGRLRRAQLTEARPVLEKLIQERPAWSAPIAWLGRLEDQLGANAEAITAYQKAFDLGDRDPPLCQRLLELLVVQEDIEGADRVYRQVEREIVPTGQLARLGAEIARRKVDYPRARRLAELASPAGPANPEYLLWHAGFLTRIADLHRALTVVREAVRLDAVNPDGWVLWVDILLRSHRPDEVEPVLAELERRQPEDLHAVTLAQCEALRGQGDLAASYFEEALKGSPENVYTLLCAAKFFVERDDIEAARPLLERLRQLAPGLPEDRVRWVEEQLERPEKAEVSDPK